MVARSSQCCVFATTNAAPDLASRGTAASTPAGRSVAVLSGPPAFMSSHRRFLAQFSVSFRIVTQVLLSR